MSWPVQAHFSCHMTSCDIMTSHDVMMSFEVFGQEYWQAGHDVGVAQTFSSSIYFQYNISNSPLSGLRRPILHLILPDNITINVTTEELRHLGIKLQKLNSIVSFEMAWHCDRSINQYPIHEHNWITKYDTMYSNLLTHHHFSCILQYFYMHAKNKCRLFPLNHLHQINPSNTRHFNERFINFQGRHLFVSSETVSLTVKYICSLKGLNV